MPGFRSRRFVRFGPRADQGDRDAAGEAYGALFGGFVEVSGGSVQPRGGGGVPGARPALLEEISTITAKGRTTIPKSVRQALGVDYDGKITFRIDEHGVSVHLADAGHDDPAIDSFPSFLAEDIKRRPEALTEGVKVDLDALIDNEKRSAKSRYASTRSDWRTWRECL